MLATWVLLSLLAGADDAGATAAPALSLVPAASVSAAGAGNLLRRATITKKQGAPNAERMADGTAPSDGDLWNTKYTAVLGATGAVEWDLGMLRPIGAARIQADNNDTYILSASVDGERWAPLWTARSVEVPGMQTRTSEPLSVEARYIRLTAVGGDSMYSVGELELFESVQELVGAKLNRIPLPPPPKPVPPPPFDSGLLVAIAAAGYGAYLLNQARKRNLAAAQANAKPAMAATERPKADEKKS